MGHHQDEIQMCYSLSRVCGFPARDCICVAVLRRRLRYYEWLPRVKHKIAHFTKRADGALLMLAGLYSLVELEGNTNVFKYIFAYSDQRYEQPTLAVHRPGRMDVCHRNDSLRQGALVERPPTRPAHG